MQFPNKLYSYENSTMFLIPKVLRRLADGPMRVMDLYFVLQAELEDATDFLSVMDCLYALNAIDMNEEGEVTRCLLK